MSHRITYYPFLAAYYDVMDWQGYRNPFWKWAQTELVREYPDHSIEISDEISTVSAITDDEERRDEIIGFCSRLWGRCPWTEIFEQEGLRTELIQVDSRREVEELAPWAALIVEVTLTDSSFPDIENKKTKPGWLAFQSLEEYFEWENLHNQE